VGGGHPRLSQKSGFDVAIGLCRGVNPQRPGHRLPLLFGLTLMYIFFYKCHRLFIVFNIHTFVTLFNKILPFLYNIRLVLSGPSKATAGPGPGTVIAGPYHNLILYAPRSSRPEGGIVGRGVTSPSNCKGLRSVVSSPSGARGRAPADRKWILCIFEVRKKPPGTFFQYF